STHRVSVIRAPPRPTLFPYTTLFRSDRQGRQFRGGLRTAGIRARPAARDPAWARPAATFALTSSACPASILARTHAPELANGLRDPHPPDARPHRRAPLGGPAARAPRSGGLPLALPLPPHLPHDDWRVGQRVRAAQAPRELRATALCGPVRDGARGRDRARLSER